MPIKVLIGTTNPGKYHDAALVASEFPELQLFSPADLNLLDDIDETGTTYTENARLKRDAYKGLLADTNQDDYYILGDDSGIEIEALGGEPGIHSRRWRDGRTAMTDQEIIDHCMEQMQDVPLAKRGAAFAGVMALGHSSKDLNIDIPYRLEGVILETPALPAHAVAGYPFRALFFLPQYDKLLHEIVEMPVDERPQGFRSHRELGYLTAFNHILKVAD